MILPTLLATLVTLAACSPSLSSLLSSHISSATCAATCLPVTGAEEVARCRQLCHRLASSPSLPLCSSPLCGAGCRAACTTPSSLPTSLSLLPTTCTLSWHLAPALPAVYLVAGRDGAGMWRLLATTAASSLPATLLAHYSSVTLLAVTSAGLVATNEVQVENRSICSPSLPSTSTSLPSTSSLLGLQDRRLLLLAVPGALAALALVAAALAMALRPRRAELPTYLSYQLEPAAGALVEVADYSSPARTSPGGAQVVALRQEARQGGDHFYHEVESPYRLDRINSFVRQ